MYVSALARTSSRESWGRVAFFPDGSPIIAVKSPIDEDDAVPGVLEVAHLAEDDRVPEVDVRRGRIEPDLDRHRPAGDFARELPFLDEVHDAAPKGLEPGKRRSHGG